MGSLTALAMASNPPTPIFVFEQHLPAVQYGTNNGHPPVQYGTNNGHPPVHTIPTVQFPTFPTISINGVGVTSPITSPSFRVTPVVKPVTSPIKFGLPGGIPAIELPNLGSPVKFSQHSSSHITGTATGSMTSPVTKTQPISIFPAINVGPITAPQAFVGPILPSLRSPQFGSPISAASVGLASPSHSLKSPILSMLSPKSGGSTTFLPTQLTPNSTAEMLREYHSQWMPTSERQEPVRGVASANINFQLAQTVSNHYHPVDAPDITSEFKDVSDMQFPTGYDKSENKAIASHMRSLIAASTSFARCHQTSYKNLLPFMGMVNITQFNEALAVYENNQVYYQECIDDQSLSVQEITDGLIALEQWFAGIIEPAGCDNAEDHRIFLATKGITAYCDPELYPYLNSIMRQG